MKEFDELLEILADLEHEQWVSWARKVMKSEPNLSSERRERWKSYVVDYEDLPELIKDYDRHLAMLVLNAIRDAGWRLMKQVVDG